MYYSYLEKNKHFLTVVFKDAFPLLILPIIFSPSRFHLSFVTWKKDEKADVCGGRRSRRKGIS